MTHSLRSKLVRPRVPISVTAMLASLAASGAASAAVVDYDGDHRSDFAVYRPSAGFWFLSQSSGGASTFQFSDDFANDVPLSGDFDGDGKADLAVWRPANGLWSILRSSNQQTSTVAFGAAGDFPLPGDYDGDGKTDVVVWRPSDGVWYSINSSDGVSRGFGPYGVAGDIPVPADYDGDGKTDYALFRPSSGTWFVNPSSNGNAYSFAFGTNGDIPIPADYDGDGKADTAVFRPSNSTWYLTYSGGSSATLPFGASGDIPAPRDIDGDGLTDYVVWHPATGVWSWIAVHGTGSAGNGDAGDVPVRIDGTPSRHRTITAAGDASDLSDLGVASWGMTTDLDTGHMDLNGYDGAGNKIGTVSIDMGSSVSQTTFGLPATVNINIRGEASKMVISSMTGNCRPDFDVAEVCSVTVQGSIDSQPFTISFDGNSTGAINNNAIQVSEAPTGKPVYLALNGNPAAFAMMLPSLLNSFCLSCVGKVISRVASVGGKWVESGTVKLVAKVGQLLSGKSLGACIFQGVILATEAFGCGTAAAVDVPAAGTVTPAAIVACGSLIVSMTTFKQNCN